MPPRQRNNGQNNAPIDPSTIIAEVLGVPASEMTNPVNADYACPFINSTCIKRSQRSTDPYPVCTVFKGTEPVCVCPKRFFELDLLNQVIQHCWPGEPPANPAFAHEVKMTGFGQVDFVIADIGENNTVSNFLSVELQAIDITGSYEPAYAALVNGTPLTRKPTFGLNYANVRKRYLSQLVSKGFFHHHWRTKMVAILQDHVFNRMRADAHFDLMPVTNPNSNVLFMLFKFQRGADGALHLVFDQVVGTTHSSLMTGILYRNPPSREDFCEKILRQLAR